VIKAFDRPGEFKACEAAERWLSERGFSVGRMQGHSPRGILHGDFDIQKWRNLRKDELSALHGRMWGSMRHGPVYIEISDDVLRTYEVRL
jgi:hypothetical protein